MTYQPNIPLANNAISQSQIDLFNNFVALNNIFGVDHIPFDTASGGKHIQVAIPTPLAADPVSTGTNTVIYTKADPLDTSVPPRPQVFFSNRTGINQVTNRFKSGSANGYIMLPGSLNSPAIIIMWGNKVGVLGTGPSPLTFNTIANYVGAPIESFPTNCFGVWFDPYSTDNTAKTVRVETGTLTAAGCTVRVSGAIDGYYWLAIGN